MSVSQLPIGTPVQVLDWQDYTPLNNDITVGNGTQTARFARVGNLIYWHYHLTLGSTSVIGSSIAIGLPAICAWRVNATVGHAQAHENGVSLQEGTTRLLSSLTSVTPIFWEEVGTGSMSTNNPFTWGDLDNLSIVGTYEAAS